jgi:hypothetical protein
VHVGSIGARSKELEKQTRQEIQGYIKRAIYIERVTRQPETMGIYDRLPDPNEDPLKELVHQRKLEQTYGAMVDPGPRPRIELPPEITKNRRGAIIDLHPVVVKAFLGMFAKIYQPFQMSRSLKDRGYFKGDDPVFEKIPTIDTFKRDLKKA